MLKKWFKKSSKPKDKAEGGTKDPVMDSKSDVSEADHSKSPPSKKGIFNRFRKKKTKKKPLTLEEIHQQHAIDLVRSNVHREAFNKDWFDAIAAAFVVDLFVTGGTGSLIAFLGTYTGVLGFKRGKLHVTQTWKNKAGQTVTGKGYMKVLLKDLEKGINRKIRQQDKETDFDKKKKIRREIAFMLKKCHPVTDQIKILKPITDKKDEPYYFHVKHVDGTVEHIPFVPKPFDQPLTAMEKQKKNPKGGFGI